MSIEGLASIIDLVSRLWDCAAPQAAYICRLEENRDALRTALDELKQLKNDTMRKVVIAEGRQMKRLDQVQGWFSRVELIEGEVELLLKDASQEIQKKCLGGCCPKNCKRSHKIGKRVAAYICRLEENLDALRTALDELKQLKNDTMRKVVIAEGRQMKRLDQVQGWFSRVELIEGEVELLLKDASQEIQKKCLGGCCPKNCKRSHKIGKRVAKKQKEVNDLKGKSNFEAVADEFDEFATESFERNVTLLEEILGALNWMFPLDVGAQNYLGSSASLHCISWLLKYGNLSAIQNAILVLKDLLCSNQQAAESMAEIEGVGEILVKLIKEPINPTITKASLSVIFYMLSSSSSNEEIKRSFVEMGLVSLLVEILVDSERSICENALGVFDRLCSFEEGREKAYSNALTIPVLVKKILRVSNLATVFSVSAIWKLCKYERRNEGNVMVEAVQMGAFQKLLLLLQVGCGDETKEKATKLLKLLNPYRAGLECIDSVDFKNLKRSF